MIVRISNDTENIQLPESLLSILRKREIYAAMPCGGSGQCGKCLIRVKEGSLPVTLADRQYLSEEQLQTGYRLGCQAIVEDSCVLELEENMTERDFFVPSSADQKTAPVLINESPERVTTDSEDGNRLGIAVDIGTTTIAMVLVDLDNGSICREYTGLNHQRSYGADVMARIHAAINGEGPELRKMIRADLSEGFRQLTGEAGNLVETVVIAGNTTMMHLLRGYDCSGLGQYPFHPYSLAFEQLTAEELLGVSMPGVDHAEIILMPGISAFIGADITAGLWGSRIFNSETPHLFLDLGTNAEMAVGCNGRILTTSAAAGPAFEGGRLSCGVGSIPGAIRDIKIQYGLVRYETIGRRSPVGICGTGIVAGIAEMKKAGIMDCDGTLRPGLTSDGFQIVPGKIRITQQDIREFQKAKAAIRAGIDILAESGGYQFKDIESFELAGGFGCQMDVCKAASAGLIPEELSERVHAAGNTVINGVIAYMMDPDERGVLKMIEGTRDFSLATHSDFTEKYLKYFRF